MRTDFREVLGSASRDWTICVRSSSVTKLSIILVLTICALPARSSAQTALTFWDHASKVFKDGQKRFAPHLLDGTPVMGTLPDDYLSKDERVNRKLEQAQTQLLLEHLCYPTALEKLREAVQTDGLGAAIGGSKNALPYESMFMSEMVMHFASPEGLAAYSAVKRRENGEFQGGEDMAKLIRAVEQYLSQLPKAQTVEICIASRIRFGNYDRDKEQFPFKSSALIPMRIGGVGLVWETQPTNPSHIPLPIEMAKQVYEDLNSLNAIAVARLRLAGFQSSDVDQRSNIRAEKLKTARASLISLTVHSDDGRFKPVFQWELESIVPNSRPANPAIKPADGSDSETLDGGLATRMAALAAQYSVPTYRDGVLIRADVHYGSSPEVEAYRFRTGMLMDRIALNFDKRLVGPRFAANHFPETVGNMVNVQRDKFGRPTRFDWTGANEFDQRDAENRFLQGYRNKVDQLKEPMPCRIAIVNKFDLGAYDFERGGFFIAGAQPNDLEIGSDYLGGYAPRLASAYGTGMDRRLSFLQQPAYYIPFLPMPPEEARALMQGNRSPSVCSVVVMDINLAPYDKKLGNVTFREATSTLRSIEIFHDLDLKNKIIELEVKNPPVSWMENSERARLPTAESPSEVDTDFLLTMLADATSSEISSEVLQKRLQQHSYFPNRKDAVTALCRNVQVVHREYARQSLNQDSEVGQAKDRFQRAVAKAEKTLDEAVSTFVPFGYSIPSPCPTEIELEFRKWLKARRTAQTRWVVSGRVNYDQHTDTSVFVLDPNDSGSINVSADVLASLELKGIERTRLHSLAHLIRPDERLRHADGGVTPVLSFAVSDTELFSSIPKERLTQLSKNQNQTAQVCFEIPDIRFLESEEEYGGHALLLSAAPLKVQIVENEMVVFEKEIEVLKESTTAETSANGDMVQAKPSDDDATPEALDNRLQYLPVEPLAPAIVPWLVERHLPDFFESASAQFAKQRWEHEQLFRNNRNTSSLGIKSSLGLFFPPQTPQPDARAAGQFAEKYATWLKQRRESIGSRYTMRIETTFAEIDSEQSGYPQYGLGREKFRRRNISVKLENQQRMSQNAVFGSGAGQSGGGFGGGGIASGGPGGGGLAGGGLGGGGLAGGGLGGGGLAGGGFGGVPQPSNSKQVIERLTAIKHNAFLPIRTIVLSEQAMDNSGYQYVVPSLDGARRVDPKSTKQPLRGAWNPDATEKSEPLYPTLEMDKEYWLPKSSGIEPEEQTFQVELEFQIRRAELMDQAPEIGEQYLGEYAAERIQIDDGRYLVFRCELLEAWILHPQTAERIISLELRTPRKPIALIEAGSGKR